ncbi:MAG: hypothetical protein J3R72DRAFT_15190 [Linnemannia gamsii]|nr:MAG: hypothetical protein J3R72DRAFT_15190 [Linnemannia gamsii]
MPTSSSSSSTARSLHSTLSAASSLPSASRPSPLFIPELFSRIIYFLLLCDDHPPVASSLVSPYPHQPYQFQHYYQQQHQQKQRKVYRVDGQEQSTQEQTHPQRYVSKLTLCVVDKRKGETGMIILLYVFSCLSSLYLFILVFCFVYVYSMNSDCILAEFYFFCIASPPPLSWHSIPLCLYSSHLPVCWIDTNCFCFIIPDGQRAD